VILGYISVKKAKLKFLIFISFSQPGCLEKTFHYYSFTTILLHPCYSFIGLTVIVGLTLMLLKLKAPKERNKLNDFNAFHHFHQIHMIIFKSNF